MSTFGVRFSKEYNEKLQNSQKEHDDAPNLIIPCKRFATTDVHINSNVFSTILPSRQRVLTQTKPLIFSNLTNYDKVTPVYLFDKICGKSCDCDEIERCRCPIKRYESESGKEKRLSKTSIKSASKQSKPSPKLNKKANSPYASPAGLPAVPTKSSLKQTSFGSSSTINQQQPKVADTSKPLTGLFKRSFSNKRKLKTKPSITEKKIQTNQNLKAHKQTQSDKKSTADKQLHAKIVDKQPLDTKSLKDSGSGKNLAHKVTNSDTKSLKGSGSGKNLAHKVTNSDTKSLKGSGSGKNMARKVTNSDTKSLKSSGSGKNLTHKATNFTVGNVQIERGIGSATVFDNSDPKTRVYWALTRVNMFEDGSKEFEVLEVSPIPPGHYIVPYNNSVVLVGNQPNVGDEETLKNDQQ